MNEALIRQCAREAARDYWMERHKETGSGSAKRLAEFSMEGVSDGEEDVGSAYNAIRLYHARHVAPLVEALREITEGAQTTYRARNGRQCSIEADDGELCLIVHSDLIDNGKQALAPFQQEAK